MPSKEATVASVWRPIALYAGALVLTALILVLVLKLWKADLSVPFAYGGDAFPYCLWFKTIVEHGWYLTNPRLGAPFIFEMHDFPVSEGWHFLVIKCLAVITRDWAFLLNVYYLLSYPLVTLTALFTLRKLGVAAGPALVGSLLYAFLPYHFLRNEEHLLLSAYYLIPLLVLIILDISFDLPFFSGLDRSGAQPGRRTQGLSEKGSDPLPNPLFLHQIEVKTLQCAGGQTPFRTDSNWLRTTAALILCVMIGSSGVYYAFFGCYFLLGAGIWGTFSSKKLRPMVRALSAVGIIGLATLGNLLPSLAYWRENGPNPVASGRSAIHSDQFGLKPAQLVLPVTDHRLSLFRKVKQWYNVEFQYFNNENDFATLGLVGTAGFIALLAGLCLRRHVPAGLPVLQVLGVLTLIGLLLASVGGLGSLFSLLVTPKIRAYNRISVFLAFFALAAVGIYLTAWLQRAAQRRRTWLVHCGLAGILLLGILDQTTPRMVSDYARTKEIFERDRQFVAAIERTMPAGAAVFQLPYMIFPESYPVHAMLNHDPLRCYLHSAGLRWSYPYMKGRPLSDWFKETANRPPVEMLRCLRSAGFQGIAIARHGYPDNACRLELELSGMLETDPIVSSDGWWAFYDISGFQVNTSAR